MKNQLQTLFSIPDGERTFMQVLFWWELRRVAFNAILAITGIVSLTLFALFVDGWFDFISPPLLPTLFFVTVSNFFYTGGWLAETVLRLLNRKRVGNFGPRAFKYGLLFSMFVAFVPTLIAAGSAITGNRMTSPYSQFTTVEPNLEEIHGVYYLNGASELSQVSQSAGEELRPRLELLADGAARFVDFPLVVGDEQSFFHDDGELHVPFDFREMNNALLLTGSAKWKIEQGNFNNEVWSIRFKQLDFDMDENERAWTKPIPGFSLFLQSNEPPYRLYFIMGDPDSMIGMKFERELDPR